MPIGYPLFQRGYDITASQILITGMSEFFVDPVVELNVVLDQCDINFS